MKKIAGVFLISIIFLSCSINPPKVEMTGEKTVLENQILGVYREIENDIWMVASVRSSEGMIAQENFISEEKRRVLEAIQNRRFNKDDIDEFKSVGALGENNQGYLTFMGNERTEEDPKYRRIVKEIMGEENRDRKIIMERIISIDPTKTKDDMEQVQKVFADQNREQASKGIWVQKENGEWIQKK